MVKKQLPLTVDDECYKYVRGKANNVSEYINNLLRMDMTYIDSIENINRKIKHSETIIIENENKINEFYEKKIKILEEEEEKARKIKERELQKIKELKVLKIKKIEQIKLKLKSRPQLLKEIKKDYKKDPNIITDFNYIRNAAKSYQERNVLISVKDIQDYLKTKLKG